MDGALETFEPSWKLARTEARRDAAQMIEGFVEESLGDGGGPLAVRMGQGVSLRRHRTPDGGQRTGVLVQDVTEVVEAEAVGELAEEKSDNVTPMGEGPGVSLRAMFTSQLVDQMGRNEVADLMEDAKLTGG